MNPRYGPPWTGWYATNRRTYLGDPHMRVSDAERHEVADKLSKHFGDGRLDQAEFNERMEKAMAAKTRADFAGLLDDLPNADPPAPPPRRRPPILTLLVVIIAAAILGSLLAHPHIPLLLIALLVFFAMRRRRWHHHHHHDDRSIAASSRGR